MRPSRFFETGLAPEDWVSPLAFAAVVVLVEEVVRLVALSTAAGTTLGAAVTLVGVVALIPAALLLGAAAATAVLAPLAPDHAGLGETVQVVGYATAPCVFAAVPVLEVRALAVTYGAALVVVGLSVVHRTTLARAVLAATVPAVVVFAYGFRGTDAVGTLLRRWYII